MVNMVSKVFHPNKKDYITPKTAERPCRPCDRAQSQRRTATKSLDNEAGATHHVVLFVRRSRPARCEFLKARIIAERIEHGIEPEQRGG
jgi:hypothetical protein